MAEKKYVSDNPKLMTEWNWEKNGELLPSELTCGSNKKVWWKCDKEHEWDAPVKERVRGYGCPICAGKRVVAGINDLSSTHPEIVSQWDYNKNGELSPDKVTPKSHKIVWWVCENGHSYKSSIDNRTRGRGCPYCTSKIVAKGINDLESQNSLLAAEYSESNPIKFDSIFVNSHKKVLWKCSMCNYEWVATVDSRTRGNGCPSCAKRKQSSFPEQAIFFYVKQKYPDAINRYTDETFSKMELDIYIPSLKTGIEYDGKHWHKGSISEKREKEKYLLCKKNNITLIRIKEANDYTEIFADQLIFCSSKLDDTIKKINEIIPLYENIDTERDRFDILSNYIKSLKSNSFAAKHPEIAKEWNYNKNGDLAPDMFSEFSTQAKFWWICKNGHEWQSTIANRTKMGSNCPYCSNRKLLKGYNDFLSTNKNSQLAEEWDFELNNNENIYMDSLTEGSKIKVWWKCEKGHSWKTTITERKRGSGCPYCSGRKVMPGVNDLATTHPQLALEWDYVKNNPLTPQEVSFGSNKKVWWKCDKGHEWCVMVLSRSKGYGCPYCSGRYAISGETDLKTTHPNVAAEWNYDKNIGLEPSDFRYGSEKKVWWKCRVCGKEWQSAIKDRTKGHGCPMCARKKKTNKPTEY